MLVFIVDKIKYEVGEEVKLIIFMGEVGKVLVIIENGIKVVEFFWIEVKLGENIFFFKIILEMVLMVYVYVLLIQLYVQVDNDLLICFYGVIFISVEDKEIKLEFVLVMFDELQFEKIFELEVKEKNGKVMVYMVVVVDEGLLGLICFVILNLWDYFYVWEVLGVKIWDIYD